MSLSKSNRKLQFDVRMKEWFNKHEQLKKKEREWETHLKSLEDVQSNAITISLKSNVEEKEKEISFNENENENEKGMNERNDVNPNKSN